MKITKRLSIFILVILMLITAFPLTSYAATHCTNNNNHSVRVGNTGKWFNSKSEMDAYWVDVVRRWNYKEETGEITWKKYAKKCPYGYEGYSCNHCGKFTGNFHYD